MLFLLGAIPLGAVLVQLVPTAEVPDETAHIVRAYAVSTGQWIGRRVPAPGGQPIPSAGFEVDAGLFLVSFPSQQPGGVVTPALAGLRRTTGWSHTTVFADVPNTASYAPVLYVLSGAALAAGRELDLTPALSTELARLANLAGFAALGVAALLLAQRMRCTLFAVLCLPSSLSLAASVNQDGLLIGVCLLVAALLTRPGPAARRWAAGGLAVVCLAKPPYLPLVALLLVPPDGWQWRRVLSGAGLATAAAVPAVLWSAAALRWTVVPFARAAYTPGPLYEGGVASWASTDGAAQLAILAAHPAQIVLLPLHTSIALWHVWVNEVVGVLGPLTLVLPIWLYDAWFLALACAVAADVLTARPGPARWTPLGAVTALVAVLASALMVFVVEYMTWTQVGADTVAGVQGRYFVPLLAALALAVPAFPVRRGAGVASGLALPAVAVVAIQFMVIPTLVVRHWYLR